MDNAGLTPPEHPDRDASVARALETAISDIIPLVGSRVLLLNTPDASRKGPDRGDIDLAVDDLDLLWPFRLPTAWRLCQVLHYDVRGWYWVLEYEGETIALDTIDDPTGLGRDGIPSNRLIDLAANHQDAARAAYLTAKRLRKSMLNPADWLEIAQLVDSDVDHYRRALSWIFGDPTAESLAGVVPAGETPSADLARRARAEQWLRRRRGPSLLLASLLTSLARWHDRITRPTGLFVVIAGPDGSGKTTLAEALPAICAGPFRRWTHLHWRPGVLPRLGAFTRTARSNPETPHARSSHGVFGSLFSLAYHWMDFFVGTWLRFAPFKARSGLIVLERGWLDIEVDPKRYGLAIPDALVRLLGHTLLQPDLIIVLEADPGVLTARKAELERGELERQSGAWHEVIPHRTRRVYIDASARIDEVRSATRDAIFSLLAERASARLGSGWIGLPRRSSPRWILPRGPRRSALSAMSIYQPVTTGGRLGWEAGRLLARLGALHLLPRGQGPPDSVRRAVAPFMPPRSTLAVLRSNHPGRFLALVIGPNHRPYAIAKVASEDAGKAALDKEARNIETVGGFLKAPLRAPRILAREPGLLLLAAERWIPRPRPWRVPVEVADGLGQAFGRSAVEGGGLGMAHGDCAPWNLLRTDDGWVLVDWEDARLDAHPFFDLFHYLVQSHVLLGRPSTDELLHPSADSWVEVAIETYAYAAGIPGLSWLPHLHEYLARTMEDLDPTDPQQAQAVFARRRLLQAI